MDEMLTQEEINALLKGIDEDDVDINDNVVDTIEENIPTISDADKDVIGEVSNISMGTAATTLFALVNQKVVITTPNVSVVKWDDIRDVYEKSCVAIEIVYKEGLNGTNLLVLKENDVKVITNLMMGGEGDDLETELSDLHLSAISEAMNQMIGSAATSMASMFDKKIDIAPPKSKFIDFSESFEPSDVAEFLEGSFICVSFRLQIGELVDSNMMQLYPMDFAQEITDNFIKSQKEDEEIEAEVVSPPEQTRASQNMQQPNTNNQRNLDMSGSNGFINNRNVEVQPAEFQNFDMGSFVQQKENIDLIMDVPLQVTVELGRTHRSIKEILEFTPGSIIELNKLAGEPIDILVNGKIVAKGEVVVIDENFSVRITEIIK